MGDRCPNCGEEYPDCTCGEKKSEQTKIVAEMPNEGGFFGGLLDVVKEVSKQQVAPIPQPVNIEVKSLIVAPQKDVSVALGDVKSFKKIVEDTTDVKAIVWNEDTVAVMTEDRTKEIIYEPEKLPSSELFFTREGKKTNESKTALVWEGDYTPVEFSKRDLLKFLAEYGQDIPDQIKGAIKNLKVTHTHDQSEILLDDDESNAERTIKEEKFQSNIPKHFTVKMQITQEFWADLDFECQVTKLKDRYGNEKDKNVIQLRVMNARQVMQDLMSTITDQLPKDIPRYYGRLNRPPTKRNIYDY